MEPVLTISQLADYVGVSTRTVRYYHQRGLLPEPQRTHANYRRYDADAVIRLTRITTLARSGVPLARIEDLLAASPEEFRAALAEVDRDLQSRIRELRREREQLAHLEAGDRSYLPDVICDFLDALRAEGAPEPAMTTYRDMWLLTCAMYRDRIDAWLEMFGETFDDPSYVRMMARSLAIEELDADDPEVERVAAGWVDWAADHWSLLRRAAVSDQQLQDPLANAVLSSHWQDTPASDRMGALIKAGLVERGFDLEQVKVS
jgi:DNA-binding transcriptional MerR regulator